MVWNGGGASGECSGVIGKSTLLSFLECHTVETAAHNGGGIRQEAARELAKTMNCLANAPGQGLQFESLGNPQHLRASSLRGMQHGRVTCGV